MLLIIDNYDSFTYNLFQAVAPLVDEVIVIRNDVKSVPEVEAMKPQAVILSPGPCTPKEAGICMDLVRRIAPKIPILGVCLGHQSIGAAFGGRVIRAPEVVHGKDSLVFHRRQGIFKGLPLPFRAGRYHSLIVERESLPQELQVEADTPEGTIMALKHKEYPCFGLQFHPESILTPEGPSLVRNFLELAGCLRSGKNP